MKKLIKESKGFIVFTAIVIIVFIQISIMTRTKVFHGHEYEECVYHKATFEPVAGQMTHIVPLIICTTFKDATVYHKNIEIKKEKQFIKEKRITMRYVKNIPEILKKGTSFYEFFTEAVITKTATSDTL